MYKFVIVVVLYTLHHDLAAGQTRLDPTRKVNKPPLVIVQPQKEIPFRVGHSIELPCVASGFPEPIYKWKMDGKDYDPSGNDGRVAIQPGVGTLIFAEPLPRDEGFYECLATNIMGTAITVKSFMRHSYLEPFPEGGVRSFHPKIGDALTLPCTAPKSYPRPNMYWALLDGERLRQIITDDRVTVDFTGDLHFANIIPEDEMDGNRYACIAQNTVVREIEQGAYARIRPQGQNELFNAAEIVYIRSSDEVALRGERFTLMCIFSGNPTPIVSWKSINSRELPDNTRTDNYGQMLVFVGVRVENAGVYQCTGQNEVGYTPEQRSVTLKVEASPLFIEGWKPESLEVGENETASFRCNGDGIPEPEIHWFINGIKIASENSNVNTKVERNMLTFFNIMKVDSKVVQCNITNKHGYVFQNAYLNVMEEAPVIEDPPQVNLKVAEGQRLNLTCRVYGAPKPKIVWRKRSGEQLTGGRYKIYPNGNLEIIDVSLVDAGEYSCTATNRIDSVMARGNLIVRRKTLLQTAPEDVMVEMGTEAKFTCTATTDPAEIKNMRIDWKKDGQIIDYNRAQRIFKNVVDNSLTISGTNFLDTGKYTCVASNGIDSSEAGAILTVQEPPDAPSITDVKCEPVADKDNPDITRIKAEVYWQPGRDHYAPILYYKLQFNTTFSQDTWYDILPPTQQRPPNSTEPLPEPLPGILPNSTRFDILLSPYGNYTFRVIARNKVGFSEPSQHSKTVCQTEIDVPYKNPENVIAEGDRPDNLVIFWTPMAAIEHNGPDFKYIVSWRPADDPDAMQSQSVGRIDAWHYVVKNQAGLETYKKYEVRVKAKNSKGESKAEAKWVVGYTGEGPPLDQPMDVRVIAGTVTDSIADLEWTHVDESPDRVQGFFRGYRIQFARADEWPENIREEDIILNKGRTLYPRPRYKREILDLNVTISYIAFRLRNLPPNTMVRVQIRVLNKYYVGPPSPAIEFETLEGKPGPPVKFDIIARGPTYFELEWDRPKQVNGILVGYHISFQIVSGLNLGGLQVRDAIPPFPDTQRPGVRLTGLKPDTYYRVFLTAATASGQGEPIFLDMNTLPAGVPSAPTFDITDWTDDSFTAQWEASRGNNPGSVFFMEYRIRGSYAWRRTEQIYLANEHTVWPVETGTVYQVRVVATNGMGDEAASEWLELQTKGTAPYRFKLSTSAWFYGIFIALLLIIVFMGLFIYAKKKTDYLYLTKEEAIAEEMRQIEAENAALQMGIINQQSQEYLYSQSEFGADLKQPMTADRSYEVAEDLENPEYYLRQHPQRVDYPPDPRYDPGYDRYDGRNVGYQQPVPQGAGVHKRSAAPTAPPEAAPEYSVVMKGEKGVNLQRSEGERGSKDTFV